MRLGGDASDRFGINLDFEGGFVEGRERSLDLADKEGAGDPFGFVEDRASADG